MTDASTAPATADPGHTSAAPGFRAGPIHHASRPAAGATTHDRAPALERVLRTTVVGGGHEVLLPFTVPPGTTAVGAELAVDPRAEIELGLFDARGPRYGSAGFRGVYGPERPACMVAVDEASPGFRAGPLPAGEWTVLLGVGAARQPTEVRVTVTLEVDGDRTWVPPDAPAVLRDRPGWYRGDLHAHTTASSDAWAAGTALTVAGWADACRDLGLDFAAITDHNVVGQNQRLAGAGGDDVLLLPGEEVTNWTHGHATASGLPVDAWLDWRHRPGWLPLGCHERRIPALVEAATGMGAYLAAAHPFRDPYGWQFFADAETDPAAMPHGIEVWNGTFGPSDRAAVAFWDDLLQRGWRLPANGGSDLHGHETDGRTPGTPTTVVHADALSRDALVAALRMGRSFVTRHPKGVEVRLTAHARDGAVAGLGEVLPTGPDSSVTVLADVRRGAGTVLRLLGGGRVLAERSLRSDADLVEITVPAAGFVRAEVHRPVPDDAAGASARQGATTGRPVGGRPGRAPTLLEALTNPVYIGEGSGPA